MKIKERKFKVLETGEGEIIDENDNELFLKKGDILTKEQVKEIIDAEEAHLNDFEYFSEYFQEISQAEEILSKFVNELNIAEDFCYSENYGSLFIEESKPKTGGDGGGTPAVIVSVEEYEYFKSLKKEKNNE